MKMSLPSAVSIWLIPLPEEFSLSLEEEGLPLLSPPELSRYAQIEHPRRKVEYLVGHTQVRLLMAPLLGLSPRDLPVVFEKDGNFYQKPYFDFPSGDPRKKFDLSLSHCAGLFVCALAPHPIGVDVEDIFERRPLGIEKVCEAFPERDEILSQATEEEKYKKFYEFHTLKEAYHKLTQAGFLTSLRETHFLMEKNTAGSKEVKVFLERPKKKGLNFKLIYPTSCHVIGVAEETIHPLPISFSLLNLY